MSHAHVPGIVFCTTCQIRYPGNCPRCVATHERLHHQKRRRRLRKDRGGGVTYGPTPRPPAERFWEKVDVRGPGECWPWLASLNRDGYGKFGGPGPSLAHRWSFEATRGPIPNGLQLDHLCRRRNCVNPAHLEPVVARENTQRGARAQQATCLRGHPFTSANTYRTRTGRRTCRACHAEWERAARARRRAA